MIAHILGQMFRWPDGNVVGNLLASVIWASAFEWRLRVHHRRTRQAVNGGGSG